MEFSSDLENIITSAMVLADTCRHKLVMPEHLLLAALGDRVVNDVLESSVLDLPLEDVKDQLRGYLDKQEYYDDDEPHHQLYASHQYGELLHIMEAESEFQSKSEIDVPLFFRSMMCLKESFAANCLSTLVNEDKDRFLERLDQAYDIHHENQDDADDEELEGDLFEDDPKGDSSQMAGSWRDYVLCINDHLADHNPLIGRDNELDRTIQVLCRKDKNNPLHIGEPGVGKTSIVYGLAQRIQDGKVPLRCKAAASISSIWVH